MHNRAALRRLRGSGQRRTRTYRSRCRSRARVWTVTFISSSSDLARTFFVRECLYEMRSKTRRLLLEGRLHAQLLNDNRCSACCMIMHFLFLCRWGPPPAGPAADARRQQGVCLWAGQACRRIVVPPLPIISSCLQDMYFALCAGGTLYM